MRGSGIYWLSQLVGWTAYVGLVTISVLSSDPEEIDVEFIISISNILVTGILVTHLQRILFIKFGWLNIRLSSLIPRLLLTTLLSAVIMMVFLFGLDYIFFGEESFKDYTISQVTINIISIWILILFWVAIYFTFHFFQKSRVQEVANLELKATNKESELKNLRNQLNPHFLFNSLNSIKALVDLDPKKSKFAITTLSNLLRKSLIVGKENLVSIEKEVEIARHYLDLEKIRFEERLSVSWELDESVQHLLIPPFTLQMLVENAIKHGISNLPNGGVVKVSIIKIEEDLIVRVLNSGTLKTVEDLGMGIQNIQKRLALQYGKKAKFTLQELQGDVEAKITFKR